MVSFFNAIIWSLQFIITAYFWMVLISGLLLWKRPEFLSSNEPKYRFFQIVHRFTEPLFACIRKCIPYSVTPQHDFSPLLALIFIFILVLFLMPLFLTGLAVNLIPSNI